MVIVGLLMYLGFAVIAANPIYRKQVVILQRFTDFHWQFLLLIDIVLAFVIFWPLYLVGIIKQRPLPWTTISTFAAACARQNLWWALKLEKFINGIFLVITSESDHCQKSYDRWANPLGNDDGLPSATLRSIK